MQVPDGAFKYFHFFENKHVHFARAGYTDIRMKQQFSQSQLELQAHIDAENVRVAAWVAQDPANRSASMLVSDPAHWATYGIFTVEKYLFEMAKSDYSDSYKEIHGMRPNMSQFRDMRDVDNAQNALTRYWAEMKAQDAKEQEFARQEQRAYDEELSDDARLLNYEENRGLFSC